MSEPLTELDSSPDPRPRRRVVAGLLLVAVNFVVLIGALIAALFITTRFPGPAALHFREGDAVTLPNFGERGAYIVDYRDGETVGFSFPLRNRGLVSVRVSGVQLSKEKLSMLATESTTVNGMPTPLSVGAGRTAIVRVTARYRNCRHYHEREVELVDAVTVDATVFGVGVKRRVPLDHDLVIRSPMIVDCADRTLVRGDDTRP